MTRYVIQFAGGHFHNDPDPTKAFVFDRATADSICRYLESCGMSVKILTEEEAVHWFRLGNNRTDEDQ